MIIISVSKSQIRATTKYEAKSYDKVLLRLPKGKRDTIKEYAESVGESLNGFVIRAIDETMQRDGGQTARTARSGAGAIFLPEKQNAPQGRAEAALTIEEQNERLRRMIAEKKAQTVKPAPVHDDLSAEVEAARLANTSNA